MKLYCCYTPAHAILFERYFLPSVPEGFAVVPTVFDIDGQGDFLSAEFLQCISRKIDLILASIRSNAGGIIVWSDIDIQFFEARSDQLQAELGEHDIAFQREGKAVDYVNSGFFVCHCTERLHRFFEQVRDGLRATPHANEQWVINELLKQDGVALDWTYLPFSYYARTHGWPPPAQLSLYHANATTGKSGVERKIQQFSELAFLRRFGFLGLMLTSLKYAPGKVIRTVSCWSGRGRH
ncbi:MAG TPA: putative nucleotide-diphospho-sugar transferase [Chthoniobacterales bacterium]|jgi:hypothetical protein